jgi:dTDP-4-dehydrorhamnose reductase
MDMTHACRKAGMEVHAVASSDADITNEKIIYSLVSGFKPHIIINCAAYTAVDNAEKEPDKAFLVNAHGAANIAMAAEKFGAALVHFSTDFVFDGNSRVPYVECDTPCPISVYGKSKLEGERLVTGLCMKHYILRIAWVYGQNGSNFVKAIRSAAINKKARGEKLCVVDDQIGTPTWTMDVCRQVMALIQTNAFGLYHSTSEGFCSRFDFAKAITDAAKIEIDIEPCPTSRFPAPAQRPAYSVLENRALKNLNLNLMPQWHDGFREFLRLEQQ